MSTLTKNSHNSLPGADNITRVVLPNGITILSRPNFDSPSVIINGYLSFGSLLDSDEKLGSAYFTSLSLMRGNVHQNFQQIYDSLESAGASLGFGPGTHSTSFNGHALAEDLPLLLKLLANVLMAPTFPKDQIERLRAQILTGLTMRMQDTQEMSSITFDKIIYAGHPYSRPEDGYPETIQAITREDLIALHRQHVGPKGMIIAVVGAVDPHQAIDQIAKELGSWENPAQTELPALPVLAPLTETVRRHIAIPGKSQSDLVMGTVGPHRKSPDYISASLGNSILGQFGMMGRIGDVVREQSGLAYYASSSLNSGLGPGSWEISAGVNPANLEKAIQLIREEIKRFVTQPVTAEELSDSQANYIGRLPISLESNNGVSGALLNLERYNLGLDYYQNYSALVHSVTCESILETAQRYLNPDKLAIASAGSEG